MAKKVAVPGEAKKARKKSDLRYEVDRVAKSIGLPASFVWKQVRSEQKLIVEGYKARLAELTDRVEEITREALASLVKPPQE